MMDNDGLHNTKSRTRPEQTDAAVPQFRSHPAQVKNLKDAGPTEVTTLPKKLRLPLRLSAIRCKLVLVKTRVNWGVIRVSLFIVAVMLVVGGFLYWEYMKGMGPKTVSVGGYTYSFNFIRSAKFMQSSNGMRGYATDSDHSAIVGPVSGLSQLCGLRGDPYTVAFTVQVNGTTRPVCTTQDSQDEQMFMVTFTSQNAYHEFLITYGYAQNASVDAKLQLIFESITISR